MYAVCVNVLEQVNETMAPADRKNQAKIEAAIDAYCGQRLSSRDDKMVSKTASAYLSSVTSSPDWPIARCTWQACSEVYMSSIFAADVEVVLRLRRSG